MITCEDTINTNERGWQGDKDSLPTNYVFLIHISGIKAIDPDQFVDWFEVNGLFYAGIVCPYWLCGYICKLSTSKYPITEQTREKISKYIQENSPPTADIWIGPLIDGDNHEYNCDMCDILKEKGITLHTIPRNEN